MSVNSLGYLSGLTTDFTNVRAMGNFAVDGTLTVETLSVNSLVGMLSANTIAAESGNTITVPSGTGISGALFDRGGGVYNVRAFGAVGDGATDDTASLQSALDSAVSGSAILFAQAAYKTGRLEINKPLRLLGHGTLLNSSASAIFSVTTHIPWLHVSGFSVGNFDSSTGTVSREFLVNAAVVSNATIGAFGKSLTTFAEYASAYEIGKLVIEDNRLGFARVTVGSLSTGSTHVTVRNNLWEHGAGVFAAPANLELYGVSHPIITDNEWIVYAPPGANQDIVKIWGTGAQDLVFRGNLVHNRNSDCTLAEVDIYYGGPRTVIDGNAFTNVNVQAKVWGPLPNRGHEFRALSIVNNTFVRESGFTVAGSWEGTTYDTPLFIMATRFNISGNRFVDLNSTGTTSTAIYLGRATGSPSSAIDDVGAKHCKAFTIVGNTASYTSGNSSGIFVRWRNNDSSDLTADGTIVGNVLHGGQYFFEANEQLASGVQLVANVWSDAHPSPGVLGITPPSTLLGNAFPVSVSLASASIAMDHTVARIPSGTATAPGLAFSSEGSLGLYRSSASTIALSYGQFALVGGSSSQPSLAFTSDISTGLCSQVGDAVDIVGAGVVGLRVGTASGLGYARFRDGSTLAPSIGFTSEASLGLLRPGAGTVRLVAANSAATLDLNQSRLLSMRTLAPSAVTVSAANTNLRANEVVFTIGGASGASLCIHSGGTVYIFDSTLSAKAT